MKFGRPKTPQAGWRGGRLAALMALCLLVAPDGSRHPGKGAGKAPASRPETEAFQRQHPDWWGQIVAAIGEDKRQVFPLTPGTEGGDFVANAKGFRAFFTECGVEVAPESADWRWKFSLESVGGKAVLPAAPSAEGKRVVYRRGAVTEVYENRAEGLEQRFEVARPPLGGGSLVIEGRVEAPEGSRRGAQGLGFGEGQEEALRYDGLKVLDADGRQLSASLSWETSRGGTGKLRIVVEEEGRYPLVVDPLISAPAWEMLGASQLQGHFGTSVSCVAGGHLPRGVPLRQGVGGQAPGERDAAHSLVLGGRQSADAGGGRDDGAGAVDAVGRRSRESQPHRKQPRRHRGTSL